MATEGHIRLIVTLCIVLGGFCFPARAQFGGGTGEPNDPYLIYTPEQMNAIGADPGSWDRHFKLMADIDLSAYAGEAFNIIGNENDGPFKGVFDGNGHTLTNLQYVSESVVYLGLFGYVHGPAALITNLGLIDVWLDGGGSSLAGGIVASLHDGTIEGCYVSGGRVSGRYHAGGLAGNNDGIVSDCYATCQVICDSEIEDPLLSNQMFDIKGFVPARRVVSYRAGGLVGTNDGTVSNCYSTGVVTGGTNKGGLIGCSFGEVSASFWDIETSSVAGSSGGIGKTTATMQTAATFLAWGTCGNEDLWTINEGQDYPRLRWEDQPGQPIEGLPLEGLLAGSGTAEDPYLIYTPEELNLVSRLPCLWDKSFRLMADISLGQYRGDEFNVIGVRGAPFTGTFNGNGFAISDFARSELDAEYVGLFGHVSGLYAQIRYLTMTDPNIDGDKARYVGAVAGYLTRGTIANCYVINADIDIESGHYVGALAGCVQGGTITDCCVVNANIDVKRGSYLGVIAGGLESGVVTNCCARAGTATGSWYVGGLLGRNCATVNNCYSSADVSGYCGTGGLVGSSANGLISHCYSVGIVSADADLGGLIGYSHESPVLASFWDMETSRQATSAGGTGKTTTEMQDIDTFQNAGWDLLGEPLNGTEDIWWIEDGVDYPRLWWELLEE